MEITVGRRVEAVDALDRDGNFSRTPHRSKAVAGEINESLAHCDGDDGVKMLTAIDSPPGISKVPEPHLTDEFGGLNWGRVAFPVQFPRGDPVEFRQDRAEEILGDFPVTGGIALQEFCDGEDWGHRDVGERNLVEQQDYCADPSWRRARRCRQSIARQR